MNRKAVIYTRVSTDEQRENGFSLQDQESRLKKYCEKAGYDVVAHYQDDHSAKNFNRPQFQRLITDLKTREIKADLFLCVRMDRFSRNLQASLSMIQTLAKYGLQFKTLDSDYDLSVPENLIPFILNMVLPQVENERRGLNTKRGMRQARREGRWNGRVPNGYSWDRSTGKSIIVPNEDAKFIKLAFEEFAKGVYAVEDIRRKLKEVDFQCSRNNIHKLIRNVVYMGKIKIEAWQDEPEEIVQGIHEPLISEELFNTVQHILAERKKHLTSKTKYDENLPLRGVLICRKCGGNLTGSASTSHTGAKHYYYHCQYGCRERFRANTANHTFIKYLNQFNFKPEVLNLYRFILLDVFSQEEENKKLSVKKLTNQISELKALIQKAEDKFIQDEIDAEAFHNIRNRYKENINKLAAEKTRLQSVTSEFIDYINYGFALLYNLDGYYNEATIEDKHKILGSIFLEKLIFDGTNYRTLRTNKVLELLTSNINNLGKLKRKKVAKSDDLSLGASRRGIEPLLQE
jgi:site-specific DNA recombinase